MIFRTIILIISIFITSYGDIIQNTKISVFGTLGVSHNTNEDMIFKTNTTAKNEDKQTSFKTISDFGLQLNTTLTDNLGFIYQGYLKDRAFGYYTTEYLNLKYQINKTDSFKLGRMRLPMYMYSDVIHISPAYNWSHLPSGFYTFFVDKYDGIEYNKNIIMDTYDLSLQLLYGDSPTLKDIDIGGGNTLTTYAKNMKGLVLTANKDNLLLRSSFTTGVFDIQTQSIDVAAEIFDIIEPIDSEVSNEFKNKYSLSQKKTDIFSIGFNYDNKWVIDGEYSFLHIKDNVLMNKIKSSYLSIGYRFNNYLPYILTENRKQNIYNPSADEETLNNISNKLAPISAQGSQAVSLAASSLSSIIDLANKSQKSSAIGIRIDYNRNIMLKFQYSYIDIDNENRGVFVSNEHPNISDMNVYTFGIGYRF